MSNVMILFII